MSEAKHTPGPWKAEQVDVLGNDPTRWAVLSDGGWVVASIENGIPGESLETEAANAAYIVRACNAHEDLLAALEAMVDCQDEAGLLEHDLDGHEESICALCMARAAIAKARGQE